MKTIKNQIKLTMVSEILGTTPGNPDTVKEHIVGKIYDKLKKLAKDDKDKLAELEAMDYEQRVKYITTGDDGNLDKATTWFSQDEGGVFIYDYIVRGFLKEALKTLIDTGDANPTLNHYNVAGAVDQFVFVWPRKLYLHNPDGSIITDQTQTITERSLRAKTAMGDRIALARSATLPEGTWVEFEVELLETKAKAKAPKIEDIFAAFDYGMYKGLGQWRSGGHGRFSWEIVP